MSTTATALCDGWLMNRYCLRPTSRSAITRESFPASVMCATTSAESPLLPFAPIAAGPNTRSASNEAAALFLHRSSNCDFMSASFDLNYGPWLRTLNYGPWLRTHHDRGVAAFIPSDDWLSASIFHDGWADIRGGIV